MIAWRALQLSVLFPGHPKLVEQGLVAPDGNQLPLRPFCPPAQAYRNITASLDGAAQVLAQARWDATMGQLPAAPCFGLNYSSYQFTPGGHPVRPGSTQGSACRGDAPAAALHVCCVMHETARSTMDPSSAERRLLSPPPF